MDLVGMTITEDHHKAKFTVLCREGGSWQSWEVSNLVDGLMTEVIHHPKHSEYLVLFGHFTKEQALKAHGGGLAFTASQVVGIESKELPFKPSFI